MSNELDYIRRNLEDVMLKIERAAQKSGRSSKDIKLIAVTKTVEPEKMMRIIEAGITDLGENRVQEFIEKYDIISKGCNWHLIGHLQTNKVKYIADKISMIHSVDSMELALEIEKRFQKLGKTVDILVQVNISGEESKFGISPEFAPHFIKQISTFKNLKVKGLMTIAPYTDNPESARYVFRNLRNLSIDIEKEKNDNIVMDILSMGMSNDYEAAIEEGSNTVRIGTALFGKRY